jgi:hypothetical protein
VWQVFFTFSNGKSIVAEIGLESKFRNTLRKLGCQMLCFQTKSNNLGKFWTVLRWQMLVYFMALWSVLWPSGIFYDFLVYFMAFWYILR